MKKILIKIILSVLDLVIAFYLQLLVFREYFFIRSPDFASHLIDVLSIIIILNAINLFLKNKYINYFIILINIFYYIVVLFTTIYYSEFPPDRIMLPLIIGLMVLVINLFLKNIYQRYILKN